MKANILIVDCDGDDVGDFVGMLQASGYSARTVESQSMAVFAIFESSPDMVLMNMDRSRDDDLDCLECVNVMRRSGFDGLVCIMTGDGSPASLINSAIAGVDSYFVKGAQSKLMREIERLLKTREPREMRGGGDFNAILDGIFLRSLGLAENQIDLLWKIHLRGYPDEKGLAYEIGIDPNTLTKRLSRIKKKLGLDNMRQVAQLMTALSVFGHCRRGGAVV